MNINEGLKVLVLGASGGIGNKLTKVLLTQGYEVFGTYYKHPKCLKNLEVNSKFFKYKVDLKNISSIKRLKENILKKTKDLFAIINCTGIVRFEGSSIEEDFRTWGETIAVNLSGNYYLAKLFFPVLQKNGRFIMISSTDAFFGGPITSSYAVSKAGINSLVKSFCLWMKEKKIRVNALAPGWVETPMTLVNGRDYLNKVAAINPLERNAQPEDVALIIKFLLSTDSDYLNGQTISVEGGYTNQDTTLLLEEEVQEKK